MTRPRLKAALAGAICWLGLAGGGGAQQFVESLLGTAVLGADSRGRVLIALDTGGEGFVDAYFLFASTAGVPAIARQRFENVEIVHTAEALTLKSASPPAAFSFVLQGKEPPAAEQEALRLRDGIEIVRGAVEPGKLALDSFDPMQPSTWPEALRHDLGLGGSPGGRADDSICQAGGWRANLASVRCDGKLRFVASCGSGGFACCSCSLVGQHRGFCRCLPSGNGF